MTQTTIPMSPGDDVHLTLLMAPQSLNLVTGQDREHLLAFGRAAFEAGKATAEQGKCLHQIAEPAEPSPTAGMSIAQRIMHVGGRNNAAGYVEFGSTQAVEALVRQVLRDLPAASQAVQAAVPGDVVSDLKNALADATELRQQLRLMEDHARGEVWRWQTDAENDLAAMGNRMGVLIYAADLRNLLSAPAHPADGVPALEGWRIDTSAGRDILVFNDCSVIEDEQAHQIMRLLAATHPTQQGLDAMATRYEVNGLTVDYRGNGKWAVIDGYHVLDRTGGWKWEPSPSTRTDEWIALHRFDSAQEAIAAAALAAQAKQGGV